MLLASSVIRTEGTAKPDAAIVLISEGAGATEDVEQVLTGDGAGANSLFV